MKPSRRAFVTTAVAAIALLGATLAIFLAALPRGGTVLPSNVPSSWSEFRTSPGHKAHVGRDKVTCRDCHDYEHEGFKSPGAAVCVRCHDKEGAHAHKSIPGKTIDCLTCHTFSPSVQPPKCIECHREAQGDFAAVAQHRTTDCSECHRTHESSQAVPKDCTSCHKERAPEHTGKKGCLDCHGTHTPASAAVSTCSTCHAQPTGPRPADHDSCIGCHKPHEFTASARTCMGCHGDRPTFLAARVEKHSSCTSCHEPHAPASAAQACESCHAPVKVSHANRRDCVNCHQPHEGDVEAKARACTDCHSNVGLSDRDAHAGGTRCASCHAAHDFRPAAKPDLCSRCHERQTTLTALSRGHADCTGCHGTSTHRPARASDATCVSCHAAEQSSAPSGHRQCTGCHEPHQGGRLPQAACTSCHGDRTGGPHDAVKGGCETCHRAHGPKGSDSPPTCVTCHAPAKLPGLHAIPLHGSCVDCHSSHTKPRSDRATCTGSCHADRHDHQAQAAVCTGCHVFRR